MKGVMGALSCWGYGYAAKVMINGVDIGVQGGKSEARRVFTEGHEMEKEAPPEMRRKLFILKEGKNDIKVEFSRVSGKNEDYLQVVLELEGYPAPVFVLHSRSKPSGRAESGFTVAEAAAKDFKPILVSDSGRAVLVHVGSSGFTVTPVLNGREGTTIAMMPGQVLLEEVRSGKNELAIRYYGDAGRELTFAIATPEWTKFISRKVADSSEKTETFTFSAPA